MFAHIRMNGVVLGFLNKEYKVENLSVDLHISILLMFYRTALDSICVSYQATIN